MTFFRICIFAVDLILLFLFSLFAFYYKNKINIYILLCQLHLPMLDSNCQVSASDQILAKSLTHTASGAHFPLLNPLTPLAVI
jgi:hypothetical protein